MKNKLRKLEFNCYINNSNLWVSIDKIEGLFHQWGLAIIDEKNITIAIVETENGKIYRVVPEAITFLHN